ncbi:MAG: flagellar biosynthesis protein FlhB [Lachnospiraceae bacterium]
MIEKDWLQNLPYAYDLQWFAKDGPGGEKTEPATEKKLTDARKEGKVSKSKELTNAFQLIVLFLVLKIFINMLGEQMHQLFPMFYNKIPEILNNNPGNLSVGTVVDLFDHMIATMLKMMAPFFLFGFVIVILSEVLQVGWKVTGKPLQPKFDKFNPINGFKRIISKDSLFELLKSFMKIGIIVYIAYNSVEKQKEKLFILYEIPLVQAVGLCGTIIIDVGLKIAVVYLLVGILDFVYQKHKFKTDMMMTKQEVKDEYKNTEGDPEIKGRQKQRMREASQRRMMQDIPKADVVITNPTHLAVALAYDPEKGKAPVVLAKGEDYLAQKIKEVARENQVEIVENKPLARMLYANVEIGREIPPELYQAVADVLAMVYSIKHKQL